MNQSEGMRINKFLSAAGVCSRREADRLIAAGKVTVAGETAELGTLVSAGMEVKVNGRRVGTVEELASKKKVLLAVNKPVGVVCTTTRPGRTGSPDSPDSPRRARSAKARKAPTELAHMTLCPSRTRANS